MVANFHTLPIFIGLLFLYISIRAQPAGIYVLDNNQGTYRDANIRNYSFVDGFVWRTSWLELETSQGNYDFTAIDHVVQKLDTVDKKLTVLFGAYSVEPTYIALHPGVSTYSFTDPITNISTTRVVPFDGYLLQRFRIFLSAFANHKIYSLSAGAMVELKNHPVLANIATNIPGLGAIRNVNGLNTSIQTVFPNYNRGIFIDSLISAMNIQTDNFPIKNVFIPSYRNINDNIPSPTLASVVRQSLLLNFNGIKHPKISFWQENLAGFKDTVSHVFTGLPTTTSATPLYQLGDSANTMFQMLQGWTTPFLDPKKTANSTPFDAMCYAFKTFGASYFEIYVSDIDHMQFQNSFDLWNPQVSCNTTTLLKDLQMGDIEIYLYPNPASESFSVMGLETSSVISLSVYDLYGQNCSFSNTKHVNISLLKSGTYYVKITENDKNHFMKLSKQ